MGKKRGREGNNRGLFSDPAIAVCLSFKQCLGTGSSNPDPDADILLNPDPNPG